MCSGCGCSSGMLPPRQLEVQGSSCWWGITCLQMASLQGCCSCAAGGLPAAAEAQLRAPDNSALCGNSAAPVGTISRQVLTAAVAVLSAALAGWGWAPCAASTHIHTVLLCRLLHALPKVVVPDAAHVGCRTGDLQHPLCHTHRVLCGTAGNVGHILLLCQFLRGTGSMLRAAVALPCIL